MPTHSEVIERLSARVGELEHELERMSEKRLLWSRELAKANERISELNALLREKQLALDSAYEDLEVCQVENQELIDDLEACKATLRCQRGMTGWRL